MMRWYRKIANTETENLLPQSDEKNSDNQWKKRKQLVEEEIIKNLLNAFKNKCLTDFKRLLKNGIPQLTAVYAANDHIVSEPNDAVLKNNELIKLFAALCRQNDAKHYIEAMLDVLPIINANVILTHEECETMFPRSDPPVEADPSNDSSASELKNKKNRLPNCVLHSAIQAEQFDNVECLLSWQKTNAANITEKIDVNSYWEYKKYTPLVMLFTVAKPGNIDKVLEIVERLAGMKADINMGDYHHPLSILCQNNNLSHKDMKKLFELCFTLYKCDIDFDGGKARKDIEKLEIEGLEIKARTAEVTIDLLRRLILQGKEGYFEKKFTEYVEKNECKNNECKNNECKNNECKNNECKNNECNDSYFDDLFKLMEKTCVNGEYECIRKFFNIVARNSKKEKRLSDLYDKCSKQQMKKNTSKKTTEKLESLIKNKNLENFDHIQFLIGIAFKRKRFKYVKEIFNSLNNNIVPETDKHGTTVNRDQLKSYIVNDYFEEFSKQFKRYAVTIEIREYFPNIHKLLYDAKQHDDKYIEEIFNSLRLLGVGLQSSFAKTLYGSVKQKYKEENDKFVNFQIKLSTLLRELCKKGSPRMLGLFLNNIGSRINNQHPLLLITLKELHKIRTRQIPNKKEGKKNKADGEGDVEEEKSTSKDQKGNSMAKDKAVPKKQNTEDKITTDKGNDVDGKGSTNKQEKTKSAARLKCFNLILNERKVHIGVADEDGQTALHFALEKGMNQEAWSILKGRSPYLGKLNKRKEMPLHFMTRERLEAFLDTLVTMPKSDEKAAKNDIHLNVSSILPYPHETTKARALGSRELDAGLKPPKLEMDLFYYLANNEHLKPLLTHPVISTVIRVKWLLMRVVMYSLFLFNIVFATSFAGYTLIKASWMFPICCLLALGKFCILVSSPLMIYINEWKKCTKQIQNQIKQQQRQQQQQQQQQQQPRRRQILQKVMNECKLWVMRWETIKLVFSFSFLNVLCQIGILVLAFWSLVNRSNGVSAVLILLSGIDVVVHLSLLPSTELSTKIVMLKTVSKSFMTAMLIYSLVFISFGLSFFMLFDEDKTNTNETTTTEQNTPVEAASNFRRFATIPDSFMKSLVMMIGEFDAAEIPFDKQILSYLVFIVFVFLVTMIIANLINGLAVSDIQQIRDEAEVAALSKWVESLRHYERTFSRNFNFFQKHTSFCSEYMPEIIIRTSENNKIVLKAKETPKQNPTSSSDGNQPIVDDVERGDDRSRSGSQRAKSRNENASEETLKVFFCGAYGHSVDVKVANAARNIFYNTSEGKTEHCKHCCVGCPSREDTTAHC